MRLIHCGDVIGAPFAEQAPRPQMDLAERRMTYEPEARPTGKIIYAPRGFGKSRDAATGTKDIPGTEALAGPPGGAQTPDVRPKPPGQTRPAHPI